MKQIIQAALDTSFKGRIIQVTEALDRADAVSNQLIELDRVFSAMGFDSIIASKWHHEDVSSYRVNLDDVYITESDIVIFHSCGYTEHSGPWAARQYCTKVILYHNITPHELFSEDSDLYKFCKLGREQLAEFVPQFHYFWGDSQYNLDELIELGARPDRSFVVPIVVPPAPLVSFNLSTRKIPGNWVFLGRVASNKGQVDLVRLFARARKRNPDAAKHLTIVGGFNPSDDYYNRLLSEIAQLGLTQDVTITGKVSDERREQYLREAQFYVALSVHEGFGVPLVEAPLRGLPVLALDRAAARETMGGIGLHDDEDSLLQALFALRGNDSDYQDLVKAQAANASRFTRSSVSEKLACALASILPVKGFYKSVSVVICTYNRRDYLARCLDYLQCQSNPNFEVIVIDGPSDDGTKELLDSWRGRIKIAENGLRNLSISRNLGIELSQGDIVAFIDDDAIPFDNWIDRILEEYNSRPLLTKALGGPAFFAGTLRFQSEDIGIDRHGNAWLNIPRHEVGQGEWLRSCLGTNSTFVRHYLMDGGGFDEQFDYYLDESELCLRMQLQGALIGYAPEVIVRHEFAQSHNRKGRYNYDWKTIAKNTCYYVAAYSGLSGEELRSNLKQRLERERVLPLKGAFENGEISKSLYENALDSLKKGMEQGLLDAKSWPKTRKLKSASEPFSPFSLRSGYKAVGRDIPKLHICIVTKEMPPFVPGGGIGTLYYHLVSELLLMGHDVSIVVPGVEQKAVRQGPLTVHYTQSRWIEVPGMDAGLNHNMTWSITALHQVIRIHQERPVDVIDSALWDAEALAIAVVNRLERPPLVVRLVTPFSVVAAMNGWKVQPRVSRLFNNFEKELIENADAIIPISEKIASTISKAHRTEPNTRWHQSYCGITYWPLFDVNEDYNDLPELKGLGADHLENSKIILFIGRLEKRKGIDLVVSAVPAILASDPHARIVIAGSDPDGWQHHFAHMIPADAMHRVHFLGMISDAVKEKLLARAYCLLFPSRYESFGLVPLEAFVHGVPVVASRSGAIPEVVLDDVCGILFDENDSDMMAGAVRRLLTDERLHHRLSQGALARVRKLSSRNSAQSTLSIYQTLISNPEAIEQ
ncbi:MAG: glycosyltransferase [Sphingobium sp.]|uniref:glycosyltransferase n=1 Tax=Sphingobium sp. TaxID=1912891 RepID=UPI000C56A7EF|nr:glycosyltransferase [Sphingobium sp.]MBA4756579.1 glycosyltransferase [Sphingobium sp.]MBS87327.1 group 1 glycosyl transferase [Sphingobium sp.]MBU0657792.1 glycosyltransferase [Alphaproteobacteria bacterium]MBU0867008.1 glycosyltransferase [Alphaproteobacteria bacterium]